MANTFTYELSYADVPFVEDAGMALRMAFETHETTDAEQEPPRKYQPLPNLINHLNELLPWDRLTDFSPLGHYPGRNTGALAHGRDVEPILSRAVRVGEWFYPFGASRWSVFRYLATSKMAAAMTEATGGGLNAATFVMQSVPIGAHDALDSTYRIETSMYMLPPRPLSECGIQAGFDGLYLITLVDERYHWQYKPVTLHPTNKTTWADLVNDLGNALGISLAHLFDSGTIEAVYLQPEPDSQLWTNFESAAELMDVVAANVSRSFVRKLDGTYVLETNASSQTIIDANRGSADSVIRFGGGDIFYRGEKLPAGNLNPNKNAIVPATVSVTFPMYVEGNDPVPHFVNPRYQNQRPSCWYEESYGATYRANVPILSGGSAVSGIDGVGEQFLHTTAKALFSGEAQAVSGGTPTNNSGLDALAAQLALDYYTQQASSALDEVYPGTYAWEPEGFNDITWTDSANVRQASTRVQRQVWNDPIREYQHATICSGGNFLTARGIGGPSVAQTWRDSYTIFSGNVQHTLGAELASGATSLTLDTAEYFPVNYRWRARIESEDLLMEGTSGGLAVGIVYRGIDGTIQKLHGAGNAVQWIQPNAAYGINSVKLGKGFFNFQEAWTSGGISEVVVPCPTRSVRCLAGSGATFNSITYFSGQVLDFDPSQSSGSQFPNDELCWLSDRNWLPLRSGYRYDGQLVAPGSFSGAIKPVYVVNEFLASGIISLSMLASGVSSSGTGGGGASSGGTDIGFKYYASGVTVNAGSTNTKITPWVKKAAPQGWDTHSFYNAASGSLFSFASGGIGKYDGNLYADASVSGLLSGSTSVQPAKLGIKALVAGTKIDGAEDCESVWTIVAREPGTGTGAVVVIEDTVQLQTSFHFDITASGQYLEIQGTDASAQNAVFSNISLSVQKVNAGGTVLSG